MPDIDHVEKYITETFYWLHRHPELSYEEIETTKRIRMALDDAGIRVLDLPLKTGVVAEIGHGKPVTAIRCDIDGLPILERTDLTYRSEIPGRMHGCGHDFHTATILGAALLLKQREKHLQGTIKVIFQPAEEAPGGAKTIIATGALNDVNSIYGIHSSPLFDIGTVGIREGAVTASVDRFVIHFRGKGTHGAHPNRGVDPIPLAAAFIQSVQTIVSRNLSPFAPGLVSVTHIEAGTNWNIIPEEALLEGTTRSLNSLDRNVIKERVYALAENIATAYGAECVIDWYAGPPPTDNSKKWTGLARDVARRQGFNILSAPDSLAGEDFAFYQEIIEGAFLLIGTGKSYSNHNPKFQVDPTALFPAAAYMAALAEAALQKE